MATNHYITQGYRSEQKLYEDLVIESIQFYGQDVYYLPRDIVNEDKILGHDVPSRFNSSYIVEVYPDNVDAFDGEGDLFTKFGIEIRDQMTLVISRRRWKDTVSLYDNEINSARPREGDLIYLPVSNSMLQIMHVEHEEPFYQLKNLPVYKLRCELFEYSDEDFDTGVEVIDSIESTGYEVELDLADSAGSFIIGETIEQVLSSGKVVSGEVTYFNDSDDVIRVTHVGTDSDWAQFTTRAITGLTSGVTRTVIDTEERLSGFDQNDEFTLDTQSLFDFSESNPFGEPEER
jgi:hypothetical protein